MSALRMESLHALKGSSKAQIWVTTPQAFMQKTLPLEEFSRCWLQLREGTPYAANTGKQRLHHMGYRGRPRGLGSLPGSYSESEKSIHLTAFEEQAEYRWHWSQGLIQKIERRKLAARVQEEGWEPVAVMDLQRKQECLSFLSPIHERGDEERFWREQPWWPYRASVPNPNYWLPRLYNRPLSSLWEWMGEGAEVRWLKGAWAQAERWWEQHQAAWSQFRRGLPATVRGHWPEVHELWCNLEDLKPSMQTSPGHSVSSELPKRVSLSSQKVALSNEERPELASGAPRRLASASLSLTLAQSHPFFVGDYVVHRQHGIGRYQGLKQGLPPGFQDEYCELEYANAAKLYVPVGSIHQLYPYRSACHGEIDLDQLGSGSWSQRKMKALQQARDEAALLLEAHLQNHLSASPVYALDSKAYAAFCKSFPYPETPDQAKAIEEVLGDLASSKRMDRLICGEVGFGKTEVAIRAAFVVAKAQKQVALLTPTTLLAQQHFDRFKNRFEPFGFKVAMISRFVPKPELIHLQKKLKAGEIDLLIGTTQMLQPKFQFRELGLLIIDEEHRLGVLQKEVLQTAPNHVKRLTLTASPIPRTLSLAFGGVKSLSIMSSAPRKRRPVKTLITAFNEETLCAAIERELSERGQVYFVHASIAELECSYELLKGRLPHVQLLVAHGNLSAHELETRMMLFYQGKYQVLICSSIIEIGLDVPNANTLIVKQVERFGLAQLHQLRGRVGRSERQAYAYFFFSESGQLKASVQNRLEALEKYQSFGAGYLLAEQDLELRGSGEVLGSAQSGKKHGIGLALYHEILRELASEQMPQLTLQSLGSAHQSFAIENFDLGLPQSWSASFMPKVEERLRYYRGIAACVNENDFYSLKNSIEKQYGALDVASELFWRSMLVRHWAKQAKIRKLIYPRNKAHLIFFEPPRVEAGRLPKNSRFFGVPIAAPNANEWKWSDPGWRGPEKVCALEDLLRFIHRAEHAKLGETI